MPRPLVNDLTGQRYGRLQVVRRADNRNGKVYWHCVCDCGNEKDVQSFDLMFGKTRSCGCYRSERQKEIYGLIGGIGKSAKSR